jgi:hypothetical protein
MAATLACATRLGLASPVSITAKREKDSGALCEFSPSEELLTSRPDSARSREFILREAGLRQEKPDDQTLDAAAI